MDRISPRRTTAIVAIFVYAILGYAISTNMLVPLLPSVEKAYHVNAVAATWVTLATLLVGALVVPSLCRVGDVFAMRKTMLVVGLACVAAGGAIAASTSDFGLLLLGRGLQGIGLVSQPMMSSIVNEVCTPVRRKVGLGLLGSGLFLGAGGGGVLASLVISRPDGFRLLFWLTVVLPVTAVALVIPVTPKDARRPFGTSRVVDLAGAFGFVIPAAALAVAFSYATTWGWGSARFLGLVALAAVIFPLWILAERRTSQPLIDQRVFWSKPMVINNAVGTLVGFAIFGSIASVSVYLQLPPIPGVGGQGTTVLKAALLVLPTEIMIVWMAPLVGYLTRRVGKGVFLTAGPVVQALGYLLLIANHGSVAAIFLGILVIGFGTGLVGPVWGLIYVEDIPAEHIGRVYGAAPILAQGVGGSISGAIFGAILVHDHLPQAPIPDATAFTTFWWIAVGCGAVAALAAAVYWRSVEPELRTAPGTAPIAEPVA
jgi:MFS family permease